MFKKIPPKFGSRYPGFGVLIHAKCGGNFLSYWKYSLRLLLWYAHFFELTVNEPNIFYEPLM